MTELRPVLYADDDDNDVFLMGRAFEKCGIPNPFKAVVDGKEAVAYLAGNPPFNDRRENPLPCLVLLDLSMPGKHGLEVLTWIKSERGLALLPVLVFSSSSQERDIQRAYALGADGFLVKPGDPDDLQAMVKSLQQYWLSNERPAGTFVDFARPWIVFPHRLSEPKGSRAANDGVRHR